ncbi:uncharacterized protein LOC115081427 [Rhinatrema bivittatum]|uniref:uncharacterized protein LOC115081427 n=1 Tax=Rhinatrema bivittatum TaxID=194408 RepID=UPI001128A07D|nr:uncharacterized protein LOC115081427 [Rhinatrema bivittatum]
MTVRGSGVREMFVAEGGGVEFPGLDPSDLREGSRLEWLFQEIGADRYRKLGVVPASGSAECAECDPRRRRILPDTSLLLPDARPADAGNYQCFRYDGPDEPIQTFRLAVLSVAANASAPVQEGSVLTLNCSVTAPGSIPRVNFRWTDVRGNQVIHGANRQIWKTMGFSLLTIVDVRRSDSEGPWSCILSMNGAERAQQVYDLQVSAPAGGNSAGGPEGRKADSQLLYIVAPVVAGLALLLILVGTILCLKKRKKMRTPAAGKTEYSSVVPSHARNAAGQPDGVPMQNQDPQLQQDEIQYATITHQASNRQVRPEESAKESVIYAALTSQDAA